jgi:uncharacterized protein YyaL (SSP411 family)
LVTQSDRVVQFLKERAARAAGDVPGPVVFDQAYAQFAETYDGENGGFGGAPKFPVPPNLSLLLRHSRRTGDPKGLEMVDRTLTAMRLGGVYDQIGFGLHRYSTDRVWRVPHFEKMLYDQALYVMALLDAYQAGGNELHAQTAREVLTYVLRDLTAPEGGFYSAEDADSEGKEGTFYLWTPTEIVEVLGDTEGAWFNEQFQIVPEGNFVEEARRERTGESIPHLKALVPVESRERIEAARKKLFAHREGRVHPQKDDKILTDWNGLMIAALARAAQVFDSVEYRRAAERAAGFALQSLRLPDGRLVKRFRAGQAGLTAHLEDYAFLTWGLVDLYEATFDSRYFQAAVELTSLTKTHFWDSAGGGFFMTADDSEELLVRTKTLYGGAIPSGNAVAALNLARLHRMTGDNAYEDQLEALIKAFGPSLEEASYLFPVALHALEFVHGAAKEIVISGDPDDAVVRDMLGVVRHMFLPEKVVLFRSIADDPEFADLAPFAALQRAVSGKATAYVCERFACKQPVHTAVELEILLRGSGK